MEARAEIWTKNQQSAGRETLCLGRRACCLIFDTSGDCTTGRNELSFSPAADPHLTLRACVSDAMLRKAVASYYDPPSLKRLWAECGDALRKLDPLTDDPSLDDPDAPEPPSVPAGSGGSVAAPAAADEAKDVGAPAPGSGVVGSTAAAAVGGTGLPALAVADLRSANESDEAPVAAAEPPVTHTATDPQAASIAGDAVARPAHRDAADGTPGQSTVVASSPAIVVVAASAPADLMRAIAAAPDPVVGLPIQPLASDANGDASVRLVAMDVEASSGAVMAFGTSMAGLPDGASSGGNVLALVDSQNKDLDHNLQDHRAFASQSSCLVRFSHCRDVCVQIYCQWSTVVDRRRLRLPLGA
jgi:hypothetical protein